MFVCTVLGTLIFSANVLNIYFMEPALLSPYKTMLDFLALLKKKVKLCSDPPRRSGKPTS